MKKSFSHLTSPLISFIELQIYSRRHVRIEKAKNRTRKVPEVDKWFFSSTYFPHTQKKIFKRRDVQYFWFVLKTFYLLIFWENFSWNLIKSSSGLKSLMNNSWLLQGAVFDVCCDSSNVRTYYLEKLRNILYLQASQDWSPNFFKAFMYFVLTYDKNTSSLNKMQRNVSHIVTKWQLF